MAKPTPRLTAAQPELTWRRIGRFAHYSDGTVLPIISGGDGEDQLTELLARAGDLGAQSDEELAQLDIDLAAAAEATAAGDLTDDVLAQLELAAAAVQAIRAEQETRSAAAADRAERAEAALALVRADAPTDEGEPAEGEPEAEAEVEPDTEAEVPPVEGEAEAEAIAAAARPRQPVTRVRARRPAAAAPRADLPAGAHADLATMGLTAGAAFAGHTAGAPIVTAGQLGAGFAAAYRTLMSMSPRTTGAPPKVTVATSGLRAEHYPTQFRLGSDAVENSRRIERARREAQANGGVQASVDPARANSRTASGGICAPAEVRYDLPYINPSTGRPMRDGFMTRFGVDRGAVQTLDVPTLADLDGSFGVWAHATDLDPDTDVKGCLEVVCPADLPESVVDALYQCLRYGNFRARYFPEQIDAWMALAAGVHARKAEQRLLAQVAAGSVGPITLPAQLGVSRDILRGLDRGLAGIEYVHRMDEGVTMQWAAPRWLLRMWRADIAAQLPVGTLDETLAVADATIERQLRMRGVEPVLLRDGESGQGFSAQAAGALAAWPTTIRTYLAPAGSWLFLDGAELNLGLMRDIGSTATNDVQVFMETFEGSHFHGVLSQVIDFTTGPYGSVSATQDINPVAAA